MKDMPKSGITDKFAVFRPWSVVLWAITVSSIAVLYMASVYFGSLNQDEGWYLYSARLVSEGKLPYVDFAFTQGLVMPLVYSWAQPLVDRWGVAGGRFFTALLGLLTVICSAWLAYRVSMPQRRSAIGNRQSCAALLTAILVGVNVYQAYYFSIVKTYSLTSLFLMMGFLFLSYATERGILLLAFVSGVLMAFAAGTRLSTGVVIPVICLILLWFIRHVRKVDEAEYQIHDARERVLPGHIITPMLPYGRFSIMLSFAAGAVVTLLGVFVPFMIKAPQGVRFGLLEYHAAREAGGLMSLLILKAGCVARLLGAYFVPFSLFMVICLYIVFHQKTIYLPRAPKHMCLLIMIAASSVVVWLVQIMLPFPYDEYQVNIFPLFAVVLAVYLSWVMAPEMLHVCTAVLFLSFASVVSSPQVYSWFVRDVDRLWIRMRDQPQLSVLQRVGRNIRDLASRDEKLLTQDIYLAVETGMHVPEGMEMGPFSYMPEWPRSKAEACRVINREMLVEIIDRADCPVAAMSGYGFSVESPAVVELAEDQKNMLEKVLAERYTLFREIECFGQSDTHLRIFLKKR